MVLGLVGCSDSSYLNEETTTHSLYSEETETEDFWDWDDETEEMESEEETTQTLSETKITTNAKKTKKLKLSNVPKYKNSAYVKINGNKPTFKGKEIKKVSFQKYSKLDSKGRCGVAIASIAKDIMPKKKRGSISSVFPSGWHTYRYESVPGKYLYNRCHLIGHQLTGQNANPKNLITGTRYLNIEGMLRFEEEVADYVKSTSNHVMYRVTPIYRGNNLVASGVQMEGYSVEDKGRGISFNVYCYNVQPGIKINYKTGTSSEKGKISGSSKSSSNHSYKRKSSNSSSKGRAKQGTYILSLNTHKFHKTSCYSVKRIKPSNRQTFKGKRKTLINQGYEPCKNCNP